MSFEIKLLTPSRALFIEKECVPALLITTLVLSTLAAAYLTAGFTPLTKINALFTPLASLDTMQKTLLLLTTGAIGGFAIAILITLKKQIPQLRKEFRSKVNIEALESVDAVNSLLARGRFSQDELHAFYGHLAKIRSYIESKIESSFQREKEREAVFRGQWLQFLHQIHGFTLLDEANQPIKIDCTYELALFKKEKLSFRLVEEKHRNLCERFALCEEETTEEVASFMIEPIVRDGGYYKLTINCSPHLAPIAIELFKTKIGEKKQTASTRVTYAIEANDFISQSILQDLQFQYRMSICEPNGHTEKRFNWVKPQASADDGTGGQIPEGNEL